MSLCVIFYRIILLENTLSDNPLVGAFQRVSSPLVAPLSKGCKWDVSVEDLASKVGLENAQETRRIDLGTISLGVYKKRSR